MTRGSMDGLPTPLASKRGHLPRRIVMALAVSAGALLVSGCDSQRVDKLEERVTLVEAKAASAEKRAKAAESMVAETQTISQPDPVPQSDLNADNPEDGDQSIDTGDGDAPPPPMADNGKG